MGRFVLWFVGPFAPATATPRPGEDMPGPVGVGRVQAVGDHASAAWQAFLLVTTAYGCGRGPVRAPPVGNPPRRCMGVATGVAGGSNSAATARWPPAYGRLAYGQRPTGHQCNCALDAKPHTTPPTGHCRSFGLHLHPATPGGPHKRNVAPRPPGWKLPLRTTERLADLKVLVELTKKFFKIFLRGGPKTATRR